jgi:nitroreductase
VIAGAGEQLDVERRAALDPRCGLPAELLRHPLPRFVHGSSLGQRRSLCAVDLAELIRSRRTIKAYAPAPVDRATLDELFELARWAPNHNLTNPWRFRVLGPEALGRLKHAAGPEAAAKLDRAPTLVAASVVQTGDAVADAEDRDAAACACYIVLLAAHDRGLGGYWRTPGVLRTSEGLAACGIPDREAMLGLLHLGEARGGKPAPEREPVETFVSHLP